LSIPGVPDDLQAMPFAVTCEMHFHCCTNTGLNRLVRTGKLQTFMVGRHRMVTRRAIRQCQELLAAETAKAEVKLSA
jgi:hypothetical protein